MNISGNFSFDYNKVICTPIFVSWSCACVLLLPIFLYVLHIGFQQLRKPRSRSSTHSDVFTFHMCAFEVLATLGNCFWVVAFYTENNALLFPAGTLRYMTVFSQILFHTLVCLERYVAVVHPITYLRLKKEGKFMRSVSIGAVWLFSFGMGCLYHMFVEAIWLTVFATGIVSLISVSFFCASVLYVLVRPGPGERKRVDQSKRRAFHTIAAVTVALMLKFCTIFVSMTLYWAKALHPAKICLMTTSVNWFHIPSSLVMPLLFLYRRIKQGKVNPQ